MDREDEDNKDSFVTCPPEQVLVDDLTVDQALYLAWLRMTPYVWDEEVDGSWNGMVTAAEMAAEDAPPAGAPDRRGCPLTSAPLMGPTRSTCPSRSPLVQIVK